MDHSTILIDPSPPLTPSEEERRLALLERITAARRKVNVLNGVLSDSEQTELIDLTRRKLKSMESMQLALALLDTSIDQHFSPELAVELKRLLNHCVGFYLNVHQYHNGIHCVSMIRETLNLADLAEIGDDLSLKILVLTGLFHDMGNGEAPVAPDSEDGDEIQGVVIFLNLLNEVDRRRESGEPLNELAALETIRSTTLTLPLPADVQVAGAHEVTATAEEVIAAGIAGTVFRDRFADLGSLGFGTRYNVIILNLLKEGRPLLSDFERFVALSQTPLTWLTRDGDIAGSTESTNAFPLGVLNRVEDLRRDGIFRPGAGCGPGNYRGGFHAFLGGELSKGESKARSVARSGSPLFYPRLVRDGKEDPAAERLAHYARRRFREEKRRFEQVMTRHWDICTALYILIEECHAGMHPEYGRSILTIPFAKLGRLLVSLQNAPRERVDSALYVDAEKGETRALCFDLKDYPLLAEDSPFAEKTFPELPPATLNRIFTPRTSLIRTETDRRELQALFAARLRMEDLEASLEEALAEVYTNPSLTEEQLRAIQECKATHKQPLIDAEERVREWGRLRASELTPRQIQALATIGFIPPSMIATREEANEVAAELDQISIEKSKEAAIQPMLGAVLGVADLTPQVFFLKTFAPGQEKIIERGQFHQRICLILRGTAVVVLDDGRQVTVSRGSLIGEMSALSNEPASADVIATEEHGPVRVALLANVDLTEAYESEVLKARATELARARKLEVRAPLD